jgi:ribonuclease P protein component
MSIATPAPPVAPARPQLWRVRDRASFLALRQQGHRVRSGPISVTYLAPAPDAPACPPRVAFAIGKATGGAVVRNRVRRRLRAALQELAASGALPPGTYLWGAGRGAATAPWPALVEHVRTAVDQAVRR